MTSADIPRTASWFKPCPSLSLTGLLAGSTQEEALVIVSTSSPSKTLSLLVQNVDRARRPLAALKNTYGYITSATLQYRTSLTEEWRNIKDPTTNEDVDLIAREDNATRVAVMDWDLGTTFTANAETSIQVRAYVTCPLQLGHPDPTAVWSDSNSVMVRFDVVRPWLVSGTPVGVDMVLGDNPIATFAFSEAVQCAPMVPTPQYVATVEVWDHANAGTGTAGPVLGPYSSVDADSWVLTMCAGGVITVSLRFAETTGLTDGVRRADLMGKRIVVTLRGVHDAVGNLATANVPSWTVPGQGQGQVQGQGQGGAGAVRVEYLTVNRDPAVVWYEVTRLLLPPQRAAMSSATAATLATGIGNDVRALASASAFNPGRIVVERVDTTSLPGSVAVDLAIKPDATDDVTDVADVFMRLVTGDGAAASMGYALSPGGRIDVAARTARQDACTSSDVSAVASRVHVTQSQLEQVQADIRLLMDLVNATELRRELEKIVSGASSITSSSAETRITKNAADQATASATAVAAGVAVGVVVAAMVVVALALVVAARVRAQRAGHRHLHYARGGAGVPSFSGQPGAFAAGSPNPMFAASSPSVATTTTWVDRRTHEFEVEAVDRDGGGVGGVDVAELVMGTAGGAAEGSRPSSQEARRARESV